MAFVSTETVRRKEMAVCVYAADDGNLELKTCPTRGRLLTSLEADQVQPKIPNAKLDNNLLVVLSGHCLGTFARRIYHEDNHLGSYTLKLVRIVRILNCEDLLTDNFFSERLENLGIVVENAQEKKHKNNLMAPLRNPYKGR